MKYLFVSLFSLLAYVASAQTNQLNEVQELISSYKADNNLDELKKAKTLITEFVATHDQGQTPEAQWTLANVLTMSAEKLDDVHAIEVADDITTAFRTALENDTDMEHRQEILVDIYTSKILMMTEGNKVYESEDKDYDLAHRLYEKTLALNDLEVKYPRYAKKNVSLLFTSGVFAKLAGKTDAAIAVFQGLADKEYDRPDLYDYLIELYREKGLDKKAEATAQLKERLFPTN